MGDGNVKVPPPEYDMMENAAVKHKIDVAQWGVQLNGKSEYESSSGIHQACRVDDIGRSDMQCDVKCGDESCDNTRKGDEIGRVRTMTSRKRI